MPISSNVKDDLAGLFDAADVIVYAQASMDFADPRSASDEV